VVLYFLPENQCDRGERERNDEKSSEMAEKAILVCWNAMYICIVASKSWESVMAR
jgi:hypothetical protein